ncbi:unnamed protein product [Ectocarpus sp. 12 AP-2014]
MAVFLRRSLVGSKRELALAVCSRGQRGQAPLAWLLAGASPRLVHSALPARTSVPADSGASGTAAGAARPEDSVEVAASQLQEEIFRVLCEPRPSSPSLVALVRGMVAAGAQPSIEAVEALADHFSEAKDARGMKAVLSLLKGSKPGLTALDPVGIMFSRLVLAHCRRQDVTSALAEVAEMEATGREVDVEVYSDLLRGCAIARPPLLVQVEAVWAHIQERGLTTRGGVQQDLFVGLMTTHANSAGYAPFGDNQQDQQQAPLEKVDEAWDGMLEALSVAASASTDPDRTVDEGGLVTPESWMARASALALCVRDSGLISGAAMSRSMEAFRFYRRCGGSFASREDIFGLAEVVRGLARCGRQSEVEAIFSDLRQDAEKAERTASAVAASTTKTAVDKAKTRSAATRAALIFDELLRALGARGRGLDSGDRPYGLSLLQVVEDVAAQAHACGERSQGDVDSRLTATLQAVLTTSRFLDREDATSINKAIRTALDSTAAAIAAEVDGRHFVEDLQGGSELELRREWAGPNLAALSLLALLHVSQNRWEGIPAAIDVLQEMHDRGLTPPAALAAQLETVFKRHGTVRQKRRSSFLLARALDGFGPPRDNNNDDAAEQEGDARRVVGVGEAIRSMVESSTTRGIGEWDAQEPFGAAEEFASGGDTQGNGEGSNGAGGTAAQPSAEQSYQLLRQRLREASLNGNASAGVRNVEQSCAAAVAAVAEVTQEAGRGQDRRHPSRAPTPGASESHREILRRVTVLAERGRPHAALAALQAVDGRKRGTRVAVPYRVYALLFRALANGYSAQGWEELGLAAAPAEALQWLLRGMARQGYTAKTTILNFGLEAFAVAAKTKQVREGEEEVRARVCTEAMDFMEGMRDGWNGLLPPVAPNIVSFNIIVKVMCRLQMFDQAFEAVEVMQRGGFEPDRFTFATLIHGLARAGDNDGAWEAMVEMTNRGIAPNSIVIDGIVGGFVQSGDVGEAISFAQHAYNQYGCPPTAGKFCRVIHAAAALDDGQHEARRAIVVAEQMWEGDWRGEGKTSHPVLGHANLRGLLEERGAFDQVNRL